MKKKELEEMEEKFLAKKDEVSNLKNVLESKESAVSIHIMLCSAQC